jgi:hypothetical protein
MLLVGGGLSLAATFLPYVKVYYPGGGLDPASTTYVEPGLLVIHAAVVNGLQSGVFGLLSTCVVALLVWGAPLALLAIGLSAFRAFRVRRPIVSFSLRTPGIVWVVVGVLMTILITGFLDTPFLAYQEIYTPFIGPLVALLGYGFALAGLLRLPRRAAPDRSGEVHA